MDCMFILIMTRYMICDIAKFVVILIAITGVFNFASTKDFCQMDPACFHY